MNFTRKFLLPELINSSLVKPSQNILELERTHKDHSRWDSSGWISIQKSETLWNGNEGNSNFLDELLPPGLCSPSAAPMDPRDNGMHVPLGKALVH